MNDNYKLYRNENYENVLLNYTQMNFTLNRKDKTFFGLKFYLSLQINSI